MNKYNQSALSNKGRRKIFEEAKQGGVIIQQKTTAGEVVGELVLIDKALFNEVACDAQPFLGAGGRDVEDVFADGWDDAVLKGDRPKFKMGWTEQDQENFDELFKTGDKK